MENRKTGRNSIPSIFHPSNLPTDMEIKNINLILKLAQYFRRVNAYTVRACDMFLKMGIVDSQLNLFPTFAS